MALHLLFLKSLQLTLHIFSVGKKYIYILLAGGGGLLAVICYFDFLPPLFAVSFQFCDGNVF
jgi:hypothetical protein